MFRFKDLKRLSALLTALLTLVISKIDGAERLQTPEDELQILH